MRIYDGSPRQDWEEVLRALGAFADREKLKELLFLELEEGFLLQGLGMPAGGADSDTFGVLAKRTYELLDEQVAQLMDEAAAARTAAAAQVPHADLVNYFEQALRVIGAWLDNEKARDVFFFEQEGSFVVRVLHASAGGAVGAWAAGGSAAAGAPFSSRSVSKSRARPGRDSASPPSPLSKSARHSSGTASGFSRYCSSSPWA